MPLNSAQGRFFDAFERNGHILFCTGVGIGKTFSLAVAACLLAGLNPGVNGLIVSHVLNHVRTEIIPLVIQRLKIEGLYASETKMDRTIHLTHGGSIQYGSAEKPSTLDGKNVGWLLGDEIRYWPRASYVKSVARVRVANARYPMIACSSTPEMNWIYDEFANRSDRIVIHGRTDENAMNLQPGYYDRLASSMAPGTFSQYVEGQWVSSSGSVYGQEYDQRLAIQDDLYLPGWPVDIGMDPGMRFPAMIFFQHLSFCHRHGVRDCFHVLGELVPDETPLTKIVPMARDLAARSGWRLGSIYLDPFGGNQRDQIHGITVADLLSERYGFQVIYSYDPQETNILNGIDVVKSRLLSMDGSRRLFFDSSLESSGLTGRNILRAMTSYRWPERKPGQPARSNPVEDESGHVMDALRYPCVNLFPPVSSGVKVV